MKIQGVELRFSIERLGKVSDSHDGKDFDFEGENQGALKVKEPSRQEGISFTNVHSFLAMYVHTQDPQDVRKSNPYMVFQCNSILRM